MGKTQKGAVWLDAEKTSPYEFFQYWRNVDDADVIKCLKMLTFLPLEEIEKMEEWEGAELNKAKEILAFELTKLVHGEEEATKALESARGLFAGGAGGEIPEATITDEDFIEGKTDLINLLVKAGLVPTRSEGRRAIEQGGVTVNDEKITDVKCAYTKEDLAGKDFVIRRGKKNFKKIVVK